VTKMDICPHCGGNDLRGMFGITICQFCDNIVPSMENAQLSIAALYGGLVAKDFGKEAGIRVFEKMMEIQMPQTREVSDK
jgi:hypothetical protein